MRVRRKPNLSLRAARHVRQAISEIRGSKTSIGKARGQLPSGTVDAELLLEVRKLWGIEKCLLGLLARLESTDDEVHAEAAAVDTEATQELVEQAREDDERHASLGEASP